MYIIARTWPDLTFVVSCQTDINHTYEPPPPLEYRQESSSIFHWNCKLFTMLRWIRNVTSRIYRCWLDRWHARVQVDFNIFVLPKWRWGLLEKQETKDYFLVDNGGWLHNCYICSSKGCPAKKSSNKYISGPHADDSLIYHNDIFSVVDYPKDSKFHERIKHIQI